MTTCSEEEKEDQDRNDPNDHYGNMDAGTTSLWHPGFLCGHTATLTTLRAPWSLPEIRLGLSQKSQQRVSFWSSNKHIITPNGVETDYPGRSKDLGYHLCYGLIEKEGGWSVPLLENRWKMVVHCPVTTSRRGGLQKPPLENSERMVVHCLTKMYRKIWEFFTLKLSKNWEPQVGAPSPLGGPGPSWEVLYLRRSIKMANEPEKGKTMNKVVSEKLTAHPSCSLKLIHSMTASFCRK